MKQVTHKLFEQQEKEKESQDLDVIIADERQWMRCQLCNDLILTKLSICKACLAQMEGDML